MAIQIRRGNDAEWESNKSNIVAGEPAVAMDTERMFIGTGSGTYMEVANIDVLADAFDPSASYIIGDFVSYHGKVYKFTSTHSGAWNASDVEEVALADALDALGDDVYTKAETDSMLALKADASDVLSALALKADKSDTYTKTEVNTALDLKADKSDTYTKTQVDTALNLKSDKDDTYTKAQVDSALALKANTNDVNSALALKADKSDTYTKSEVNTSLALKADKSDTYTKAQVDSALDLKANAGDVYRKTEIDTELEDYAKVDGYYESMTVGNAEQLVTNLTDTESEPFTFRTSGGNLEIGDREELKVVGGSVAWNQLVNPYNLHSSSEVYGITRTVETVGGINKLHYTGTSTQTTNFTAYAAPTTNVFFATHVILFDFGMVLPNGCTINYGGTSKRYYIYKISTTTSSFGITITSGTTVDFSVSLNAFDLTQMFGTTIADYIYNLEQTTAGAGVAFFKKYFPNDYYPYNAGEMLHVQTSEFKTVGFNAWDEEWEVGGISSSTGQPLADKNRLRSKNYIPVLPNTTYYIKTPQDYYLYTFYYDADKNFLSGGSSHYENRTLTLGSTTHYIKFFLWKSSWPNPTYNHDVCISLHWDGTRDGEYEPYTEHSYPLDDSLTLRGIPKLDADNNLYFDGDTYEHDGTVTRRYGIVDLGTLTWAKNWRTGDPTGVFYSPTLDYLNVNGDVINKNYIFRKGVNPNAMEDKSITLFGSNRIYVKDTAYTDATAFKTAMSGVYLVYELATPTTESAEPYQTPQIVDNWGTEEFVVPTQSGVEIPVGHETVYPISLRDKLESAPNLPDDDGDYLLHMASGEASYKQLTSNFPSAPTADGTYVLKATVSNGTATLTWVAE